MASINYVDELNRHYGSMGFPPYKWTVNESAPLTALDKALQSCRVTMLTSGGVSHCSMPGFDADARNDHRLDAVGGEADSKDFEINDSYYNHDDANQDINCVFPIDRLRELQTDGLIGEVAPRSWSGPCSWWLRLTPVVTSKTGRNPGIDRSSISEADNGQG